MDNDLKPKSSLSGRRFPWQAILAVLLASVVWLSSVHLLFRPKLSLVRHPEKISRLAKELSARQIACWEETSHRFEQSALRASNAEWDLMARTFLVLALANMSLREPHTTAAHLRVIDRILKESIDLEGERGHRFFLERRPTCATFASPRPRFAASSCLLIIAAVVLLTFAFTHLASWRASTSFLSGSLPDSASNWPETFWKGTVYLISYFAALLLAPIFALAAVFLRMLEGRSNSRHDTVDGFK
jgi:hypothetical protein